MSRILIAAFLAMAAASCSRDLEAERRIEIDQTILSTPYDSVVYPLEAYELTDAQHKTINHARAILIRNCLQRFGFDKPLPGEILGRPHTLIEERHGLADEKHAREWGYRQKPPPSRAVPYEMTVPAEADPILYGENAADPTVPRGGCMGEAARQLQEGAAEPPQEIARDLRKQAWARSNEDGRVKDKIKEWRTCIKATGYLFATPHDAVRHWNTEGGAHGKPSAQEVTAALGDVKCKKDVGLPSVWAAVEVAYQRQLMDENAEQLRELRQWQDAWLRNATAVVNTT